MNFAWEAMLAADRCGLQREEIRFVPGRNGSPYAEVILENLNSSRLEQPVVEINPLYRFAAEFASVFDVNLTGLEKTREIFFDIFIHYISTLDLRTGLSRQEYYLRFLLEDILDNVYGEEMAEAIRHTKKDKLRPILRLIIRLYQCGGSIDLFRDVMRLMYPGSIVYINNEKARQVLIYIGIKETEAERNKICFLCDTFLEVNYETLLFWEHHFGIIGVDNTMLLDEMVLV